MLLSGENGKLPLTCRVVFYEVEAVTDVRIRSTLSFSERKEYTDAVLCLRELPPITPMEVVPGARSRFDDIHAGHINQTLWVHLSVYFLPWHRLFVHAWEKALRDECGYTGAQPYVSSI
jgi:tyrosinase